MTLFSNLGENVGGPWLENRTMCPYGPAFDANNQVKQGKHQFLKSAGVEEGRLR